MRKKTVAIIAELIPVVSAPVSYFLAVSSFGSGIVGAVIAVTFLLAFLGFAFFFLGRRIAGSDRSVRVIGVLDWLATLYVVVFYALVIFSFGL